MAAGGMVVHMEVDTVAEVTTVAFPAAVEGSLAADMGVVSPSGGVSPAEGEAAGHLAPRRVVDLAAARLVAA
jgi:hypothetical protein